MEQTLRNRSVGKKAIVTFFVIVILLSAVVETLICRGGSGWLSSLITQDTLVLAGEHDIYTVFYRQQLDALTNAKSVTGRLFTQEESADHHCQIGNLGLVLETMEEWIREHSDISKCAYRFSSAAR